MPDGQVLTQAEIEKYITDISDDLDSATHAYGDALNASAEAEGNYRVEYAKAMTRLKFGERKMSDEAAKQQATIECEELLHERLSKGAVERYLEERCRSLRARLDAVRTLSANVRAQT